MGQELDYIASSGRITRIGKNLEGSDRDLFEALFRREDGSKQYEILTKFH
jgi:hypothetical protein